LKRKKGSSKAMGLGFGASVVASIGLTAVYALGGQPQLEGILLAVSLGGIALGLILWGEELMPSVPFVEERHELPSTGIERAQAEESFEAGQQLVERRSFVGKMLGAAVAALGLVALFPIRSLGTRPGPSLYRTPWSGGARLVTVDDEPVLADGLQVNGVLTVFPEGHTDSADAQTLLIRFDAAEAPDLPGPLDWTPEGFIAFSKVCTHAGCPVGLYQPESRELFCPCHQSVFAVMEGAKPTAGPATRALPQLPLAIDEEGYVTAQGDYLEPIGPGFWSRGRD
jgi:ubiquinol-cytochrome c reductase iron-sulfur subunit